MYDSDCIPQKYFREQGSDAVASLNTRRRSLLTICPCKWFSVQWAFSDGDATTGLNLSLSASELSSRTD
jgi:hypothetical protein